MSVIFPVEYLTGLEPVILPSPLQPNIKIPLATSPIVTHVEKIDITVSQPNKVLDQSTLNKILNCPLEIFYLVSMNLY